MKYGSKIFTEPDPNNKKPYKVSRKVYIAALYNILYAMKGIRLFDRFGFNLTNSQFAENNLSTIFSEYSEMSYDVEIDDWIEEDSGSLLTEYTPDEELFQLLEYGMDTELR